MADIKNLYIEFISSLCPFEDMEEHNNISFSDMLYNLIEIKKDFNYIDRETMAMYNRLNTLIDIFKSLGVKPSKI